jgi:hypothetical protein
VQIQWARGKSSQTATVRFTFGDPAPLGGTIVVQPLTAEVTGEATEPPALYRQLAIARPSLAARVAAVARSTGTARAGSSGLVVYDAGLVRVAPEEIAAYLTGPARRSWQYLDADITPGHTFRLQLIPGLADSIFLDGSILSVTDVSTPAGSFAAALRVRYDLDYGWTDVTDSTGAIVGRSRALTRGEIFFAPGVGPVLARETFLPRWQTAGNPSRALVDSTFAELRLVTYDVGPSPIEPSTWNAIKQHYR